MSPAADPVPAPAGQTSAMLEARRLVDDLFRHRPAIYWPDLLASAAVGWAALVFAVMRPGLGGWHLVAVLVSALAFLRAVLFIHELSHFRRGVMPGFAAVWNLIVGVPMLLPSFMYVGTHTDHHKRTLYGTIRDPEYLPLAHLSRARVVRFVAEMLLVPALLVLRFGVLTPLSWIVPPLRRVVVERMSALVINPAYVRRPPRGRERLVWVGLEVLILAWIVAVGVAVATGVVPAKALLVWYLVAALVATINQVRTLVAHHYENDGRELTTVEQLLDSVNVRGVPVLTGLAFPVGLRYHALHHFLPDMPYHELPRAHRRLMAELPDGAPYRRTDQPGVIAVVARLWSKAASGGGFPAAWRRSARDS